jgi:hypothetical protein
VPLPSYICYLYILLLGFSGQYLMPLLPGCLPGAPAWCVSGSRLVTPFSCSYHLAWGHRVWCWWFTRSLPNGLVREGQPIRSRFLAIVHGHGCILGSGSMLLIAPWKTAKDLLLAMHLVEHHGGLKVSIWFW